MMADTDYTHLTLVIDRSGSMVSIQSDMEGGIQTLLETQAKLPGKFLVDVVLFDDVIEYPYSDVPAREITGDLIVPRGSTALLDAVGNAVARLREKLRTLPDEACPANVIVVVVTDGLENASKEFSVNGVRKLVETQQAEAGWEFLFLGANVDSFEVGGGLGFAASSTINYDASPDAAAAVTDSASSWISRYRTTGEAGFTDDERKASKPSEPT